MQVRKCPILCDAFILSSLLWEATGAQLCLCTLTAVPLQRTEDTLIELPLYAAQNKPLKGFPASLAGVAHTVSPFLPGSFKEPHCRIFSTAINAQNLLEFTRLGYVSASRLSSHAWSGRSSESIVPLSLSPAVPHWSITVKSNLNLVDTWCSSSSPCELPSPSPV